MFLREKQLYRMHPPKELQYLLPFWGCLPWSHDNHDDNYYDDDRWQGLGFVFLLLSLWSAFSSGRLGEPHAYPTQDWIPNSCCNLRLQASVAFDKYQSKLTSMQERLEVRKELDNCFLSGLYSLFPPSIFSGLWQPSLPKCHILHKIHLAEFSRGENTVFWRWMENKDFSWKLNLLAPAALSQGARAAEQEQIVGLWRPEGFCSGGLLEQR